MSAGPLPPLTRRQLTACVNFGKALGAQIEPDTLFRSVLDHASHLIPAHNWSLLLLDEPSGELQFEVAVGLAPDALKHVRLRVGEGVAGVCAEKKEPVIVRNVRKSPFFNPSVDAMTGFLTRSLVCVPILFGDRCVGVVEVVNPTRVNRSVVAMLFAMADHVAVAVENARRYLVIREMADHDSLTGLYNTRFMYRDLPERLKLSATGREPLSIAFMDMDNFKLVVDTHGHLNGSRALQEAAATIGDAARPPCYAVSYGGDEFVAVLPGFSKSAALDWALATRARMSETVYLKNWGLAVHLTASYGVASSPDDAVDVTELLAHADHAMFGVKKRGKDGVGADSP